MADAYPLQWPIGRPRWNGQRERSLFKMTPAAMAGHLYDELDRMNAEDVVISSNKKPYSRSEAEYLDDPGVAVYFKRKGQELAIACDKYARVSDNLHAVGIAIESFRSLERHGTGEMVDAAFSGFKALPESAIVTPYMARPWYDVLEVQPTASIDVITGAFKRLASKYHPDMPNGDQDKFMEIKKAFEEGKSANG